MGKDKKKKSKLNGHEAELASSKKAKGKKGDTGKKEKKSKPSTDAWELENPTPVPDPDAVIRAADAVLNGNSTEGAIKSAKKAKKNAERLLAEHKAKEVLDPDENPDVILTPLGKTLRNERHAREAEASGLPLGDEADGEKAPVIEYVRDPEVDEEIAAIKARVAEKRRLRAEAGETDPKAHSEEEIELQLAHARGETAKKIKPRVKAGIVVELNTEHGREFMAAPHVESTLEVGDEVKAGDVIGTTATPEPIELLDPEVVVDPEGRTIDPILGVPMNGRGSPLILEPETGKLVAYSRTTTFIDKLDDKTALTDWKLRTALAGVALDLDGVLAANNGKLGDPSESMLGRAVLAQAEFDRVLDKLDKLEAENRLGPGERGQTIEKAEIAYKRTMAAIVSEALDLAGAHEKASHGTELHRLCEVYDAGGWDALRAENPSSADFADVSAYVSAMEAAGITRKEVIDIERRVVIDEHKVTGTLDRGLRYKPLLEDGTRAARSVKVIGDIKTGRIDYGAGKIVNQIGDYAKGKGYNPETGERENLGYSKKLGLLIHLPAGMATCTIYEVDLTKAEEGLKTLVAVDSWRKTTTEARAFRGEAPFYREVVTVAPGVTPAEVVA